MVGGDGRDSVDSPLIDLCLSCMLRCIYVFVYFVYLWRRMMMRMRVEMVGGDGRGSVDSSLIDVYLGIYVFW